MKTATDDRLLSEQYGLTKLEYFTAAALTGLLANPIYHNADVGALAVDKAMDAINCLNAFYIQDEQVVVKTIEAGYDDEGDLPW
jgi:hypothetical protein